MCFFCFPSPCGWGGLGWFAFSAAFWSGEKRFGFPGFDFGRCFGPGPRFCFGGGFDLRGFRCSRGFGFGFGALSALELTRHWNIIIAVTLICVVFFVVTKLLLGGGRACSCTLAFGKSRGGFGDVCPLPPAQCLQARGSGLGAEALC